MRLQIEHIATLAKYGGISFVAGAVNHGVFSEQRAVLTALVGMACFVLGAFLEMQLAPAGTRKWADLLGFGIVASIGLGFFTGGLQHFVDSPARSAWVVPVGFLLSLVAMYFTAWRGTVTLRKVLPYGLVSGALVAGLSVAVSGYLLRDGSAESAHNHDHDHAHEQAAAPAATPAPAAGVVAAASPSARLVVIQMDDSMRFSPASWQATAGETVRLVLVNNGKLRHELVLGKPDEIAAHAIAMKSPGGAHHHHGNAVSVAPGESAELSWTFESAGTVGMACLEPGHYEAGMKGSVAVKARAS